MSKPVFHIVSAGEWRGVKGTYEPSSLRVDGFVHCSDASQVLDTARRFFAGRMDLLLLEIDPVRVPAELRYENLEGGAELFPHIYGAIALAAVRSAQPLALSADGTFVAPENLSRALRKSGD